jgi:hypothetical protein
MMLSTNLPCGREAVEEYLAAREAEPRCAHCGLLIHAGRRRDAKYCDATCERNARYAKNGGRRSRTGSEGRT